MSAALLSAVGVAPAHAADESVGLGVIDTPGSPITKISQTATGSFQVHSADYGQTFWGPEGQPGAYAGVAATNPAAAGAMVTDGVQSFGGSGTPTDPYWLQTVGDSGGIPLTTRLSYVIGANYVRTDISMANSTSQTRSVELRGYGDCNIAGDDAGYSNVVADTAAECRTALAGGAVVSLVAATPGAVVVAGDTYPIRGLAGSQNPITGSASANSCIPAACMQVREDNSGLLAWQRDVPPGESFAVSYLVAYTDTANPPFADLVVDARAAEPEVALGGHAEYAVTVRNDGPMDADGVSVTFPLPAGMSFVSADRPGYDPATGAWSVGTLAVGASRTITVDARADRVGRATAQVISATSAHLDTTPCVTGSSANCGPAVEVAVVPVASAAESTIAASPSSIPADGAAASTLTVTARDLNGDPMPAGGDTVTMSTDSGELSAVVDNGDGTYTATLTGTAAGTATVSFAVNGSNATKTASVSLGAVATAATSTIEASPSSIPADGSVQSTVTVTVRDFNGDRMTAGGDTVTMSADRGELGSVVDNGDGTYTATLTGTVAGTATVSFTVNGANSTNTARVNLAAAASAASSTIEASLSSIPADGSTESTVTVTLRDFNGDQLAAGGDAVTISTDRGALSSVADNGDGTYTATLAGKNAGTATISFTVNGVESTNTAQVELRAVPLPPVEPAADLANTGVDIGTALALGGTLLIAGLVLALRRRRINVG